MALSQLLSFVIQNRQTLCFMQCPMYICNIFNNSNGMATKGGCTLFFDIILSLEDFDPSHINFKSNGFLPFGILYHVMMCVLC